MAEDPGERAPLIQRAQSTPGGYQGRSIRRAHFQDDSRLSGPRELERSVEEDEPADERELWQAYRMKKKRAASIVSIASRVLDHLDGVDSEDIDSEDIDGADDVPTPLDQATLTLRLPGEHLSAYDVARLFLVVLLYIVIAAAGVVAVVYSVLAICQASDSKVRSVSYTYSAEYPPIAIAIVPDFSIYHGCFYRYFDDLAPLPDPVYVPPFPDKCNYTNVTFESTKLNVTRFAMVFKSPVHVTYKQILGVNFTINTTVRDYSAIEYWLIDDWNDFYLSSHEKQAETLASSEEIRPIHTFPAGMRTWVKMSKIIEKNVAANATFNVEPNFAKYTYRHGSLENGTDALQVLFEWSSPVFEVFETIPAISVWNAVGSLCGILITLWKVGELGTALFKRMKRERSKIKQRIKERNIQKTKLVDEYLKSGTVPVMPQGTKYKLVKNEPTGFETPPEIDSEYYTSTEYN